MNEAPAQITAHGEGWHDIPYMRADLAQAQIADLAARLDKAQAMILERDAVITEQAQRLAERDAKIAELEADLNAISKAFRLHTRPPTTEP